MSVANSITRNVVHPLAKSAFTTVGLSGLYDRARPSYPDVLIDAIYETQQPGRQLRVVELGSGASRLLRMYAERLAIRRAGTGIATKALLARPRAGEVESITAVEPAEGMRATFKANVIDKMPAGGPRVTCVDGAFDQIDAETGSADIVFAGQAFHWIGGELEDAQRIMTEIGRVLKPKTGRVALIWNLEDRETAKWIGSIRDLYEVYEAGTPQYRHQLWRVIFATSAYRDLFDADAKQERSERRSLPTTVDQAIERADSKSYISSLEPTELARLNDAMRAAIEQSTDRQWIDQEQGIFAYPYRTDLVLLSRGAAAFDGVGAGR